MMKLSGKLWLMLMVLTTFTVLGGMTVALAQSASSPHELSPSSPSVSLARRPALQQDTPLSSADYYLALPLEPWPPQEIPPDLVPEEAEVYARRLTYRQAQPVLFELERLRSEGKIDGFQVRPDLHAVAVQGVRPEGREALAHLSGIAGVYPAEAAPACLAAMSEAMSQQVLGMSRVAAKLHQRAVADFTAQATDPTIYVYHVPGDSWSHISGQTTPAATVEMRILRDGRVIATDSTTAGDSGYYSFSPPWRFCPSMGYDWVVHPGDVVEVTANGHTVSTVVASLSAWVDPTTDVVAGITDPGRSVEVRLYTYGADPCSSTVYSQTVGTDGEGNFSADFSGQVDFNRRSFATLYVYDAHGNYTYASLAAYRLSVGFGTSDFGGELKPETAFTATLSRGGIVVSAYSGTSEESGYYSGSFTETIRPGDVVQVQGGGVTIQYTAVDLDATLDPATDQISGTTAAGRLVRAYTHRRTWGYVWTTCGWSSTCASTVADSSGSFTLDAGQELARGDYASFYVYDAEGNYQYRSEWSATAIVANLASNFVVGYWGDPDAGYVTVTLKSGSTVKAVQGGVAVSSWDGGFFTWMSNLSPGDTVEVTDGTVTETMTVQDFTARLHRSTGHLTGQAYGHVVAELWDFHRDSGYFYLSCTEANATGGTYDTLLTGIDVGGQDCAEAWGTGPDGHYTYRAACAFAINAEVNRNYVWGHSETPQVSVTVTLQRDGNALAVYTTTSSGSGYYNLYLTSGTPVTITQGDIIYVETGDGDHGSLPVPELTINVDAANNQIYGIAPANEPVGVEIWRYCNSYCIVAQTVQADDAGRYSADFNGLWWESWRYGCASADVGHRCSRPVIHYYNADEYELTLAGDVPSPVEADIYESDDISTTATAYTTVQYHTFHTVTDTDWVTFTVPAEDVSHNIPYRIETFDLGWGTGTQIALYDTDGATLLHEWTSDVGSQASLLWTPASAGTYYLNISPPEPSYAAHCDAVYALSILPIRAQLYLPLVMKGY